MLPTIRNILYATDLSESARRALGYAASLADHYKASLTILHVVRDVVEFMSEEAGFDLEEHFGSEAWRDFNDTAMSKALETARDRVREAARECATDEPDCPVSRARIKIVSGNPADRILEEISAGTHDLVVMGAHGRSEFMDMLVGGVARKVVRLSAVPVVLVRLPEEIIESPD